MVQQASDMVSSSPRDCQPSAEHIISPWGFHHISLSRVHREEQQQRCIHMQDTHSPIRAITYTVISKTVWFWACVKCIHNIQITNKHIHLSLCSSQAQLKLVHEEYPKSRDYNAPRFYLEYSSIGRERWQPHFPSLGYKSVEVRKKLLFLCFSKHFLRATSYSIRMCSV